MFDGTYISTSDPETRTTRSIMADNKLLGPVSMTPEKPHLTTAEKKAVKKDAVKKEKEAVTWIIGCLSVKRPMSDDDHDRMVKALNKYPDFFSSLPPGQKKHALDIFGISIDFLKIPVKDLFAEYWTTEEMVETVGHLIEIPTQLITGPQKNHIREALQRYIIIIHNHLVNEVFNLKKRHITDLRDLITCAEQLLALASDVKKNSTDMIVKRGAEEDRKLQLHDIKSAKRDLEKCQRDLLVPSLDGLGPPNYLVEVLLQIKPEHHINKEQLVLVREILEASDIKVAETLAFIMKVKVVVPPIMPVDTFENTSYDLIPCPKGTECSKGCMWDAEEVVQLWYAAVGRHNAELRNPDEDILHIKCYCGVGYIVVTPLFIQRLSRRTIDVGPSDMRVKKARLYDSFGTTIFHLRCKHHLEIEKAQSDERDTDMIMRCTQQMCEKNPRSITVPALVVGSRVPQCVVCRAYQCPVLDCKCWYGGSPDHTGFTCGELRTLAESANPGDAASALWIAKHTYQCPTPACFPIQKGPGCQRVQCTVCSVHICWTCVQKRVIDPTHAVFTTMYQQELYDHLAVDCGGIFAAGEY
jgi:hypothetical protein